MIMIINNFHDNNDDNNNIYKSINRDIRDAHIFT